MSLKTVWHWGNLVKTLGCVVATGLATGALCDFADAGPVVAFLAGMIGGGATSLWCMSRWELFHFTHES